MQTPPTSTVHVPIAPNQPPFQPNAVLSPEEFENLKRQIQLLRISQLRYIVQKYDLPANGNKTRLVQIVLNLFDAMRNTPLLSSINQDVLNIISSFHEPFTNPLEKTHKLNLQKPEAFQNINFVYPPHPFICYATDVNENGIRTPQLPLLGPIYALPGISSGKFTFSIEKLLSNNNNNDNENVEKNTNTENEHKEENADENNNSSNQEQNNNSNSLNFRICLDFAWPNNQVIPFEMNAEINHYQLQISNKDPFPLPIDITDYCKLPGQPNSSISPNIPIEFKSVQIQTPMVFSIRQYKLDTIKSLAADTYSVDENSLVQLGPIKQPINMDQPVQNWVEELAKQLYQPKQ